MRTSLFLAGALMLLALNGCAVVGGIFKAGVRLPRRPPVLGLRNR